MNDEALGLDRRTFLARTGAAAAAGVVAVTIGTMPMASADGAEFPKRQFRAMWISTVVNIDWPSRTGLDVETQKAEYLGWLDLAQKLHLNAVIVQVRPTADAFWPSRFEPWSQYLTGTQGQDPGYDPLAFLVEETHRRNLEFHAWFNPYRVSMQTDPTQLVPSHPARVHPDWAWAFGPKLYYDPGKPEVRRFVEDAMLDAVRRYDIDAVHFDDYFYPYPIAGQTLPDAATFAEHADGYTDIDDWRRHNIDLLVEEMHHRIHRLKPWMKFGISPFGIWRNQTTDPLGSATSGTQSYEAIYADTRRWVKEGWLDYINPQIYWQIGLAVADYAALVPWWSDVVTGTHSSLYIGQATYKETSGVFTDPAELSKHLDFNEGYPAVKGDVWFSAKDVRTDAAGSTSLMVANHYSRPALVPRMPHLPAEHVGRPVITDARRSLEGVSLRWGGSGHHVTSYAIYRFDGRRVGSLRDAAHLIGTQRATHGATKYVDATAEHGSHYTYVVTALDRLWNEGEPSRPVTV
jgi:uncharacterized lipoprotein YddW (UPF0748 family)